MSTRGERYEWLWLRALDDAHLAGLDVNERRVRDQCHEIAAALLEQETAAHKEIHL
jgi:hypothetical protein